MTEYHKIETLYERDKDTHKLMEPLVFKNRTYELVSLWRWSEKIDGSNIRISWKPNVEVNPQGVVRFDGRQNNSQIDTQLLKHLQDTFTEEKFRNAFSDKADGLVEVVLYGEGYGAGIQKGGSYNREKRFILFDVMVSTTDPDNGDNDWWLAWENVQDVAEKMGISTVPDFGVMTLAQATELVRKGFLSPLAHATTGEDFPAEGLVGRPLETLFDKKHARLIVKLKTKDFGPCAAEPVAMKDPVFECFDEVAV